MYRIWVQVFKNGEHVGSSMSVKAYVRKSNAERVAKRMCKDRDGVTFKYWISEENPWRKSL